MQPPNKKALSIATQGFVVSVILQIPKTALTSYHLLPSRLYCRLWNFTKSTFRLVGCTTGRESHPALKNSYLFYKPMICTLKCFVKVFLIIKNNIVKEIIFLALYVVWLFVSVIILAACTISIVSAIPAAVISITSISLVIDIVFAAAAVF